MVHITSNMTCSSIMYVFIMLFIAINVKAQPEVETPQFSIIESQIYNKMTELSSLVSSIHSSINNTECPDGFPYLLSAYDGDLVPEYGPSQFPNPQPINLDPNPEFNNVSANVDYAVFQLNNINQTLPLPGSFVHNELCKANSIVPIWKNARLNSGNQTVWWYQATPMTYTINPAFDWNSTVGPAGTYNPIIRPWYDAATTGQKDIFIVLDISTEDKFNVRRSMAIMRIQSLSVFDYMTIVTFSTFSNTLIEAMQATDENKAAAVAALQSLEIPDDNQVVDFNQVLSYVTRTIKLSTSSATSNCHQFVMFITSDRFSRTRNSFTDEVIEPRYFSESTPVFTYLFPSDNGPADPVNLPYLYQMMACSSNGQTYIVDERLMKDNVPVVITQELLEIELEKMDTFISKRIRIEKPRFPLIYEDAFGQGQMTTAAVPVYDPNTGEVVSVHAVDILLSAFNGISADEINDFILKFQTCETYLPTPKPECPVDPHSVDANTSSKPYVVDNGAAIITGISVMIAFIGFVMAALWICHSDNFTMISIFMWFMFLMGVLLVSLEYGLNIYPVQIRKSYYVPTDIEITDQSVFAYPCTEVRNCQCTNYYSAMSNKIGGITCNSAAQEILASNTEWKKVCQTGYHCCKERTYCSGYCSRCSTSKSGTSCSSYCCSYTTECVKSVKFRKCDVVKGTCYRVRNTLQYEAGGKLETTYQTHKFGLNKTESKNDYLINNPIGYTYKIYYAPWNTKDITRQVEYNDEDWAGFGVGVFFLLIGFALFIYKVWTVGTNFITECCGSIRDHITNCCSSIGDCLSSISCSCSSSENSNSKHDVYKPDTYGSKMDSVTTHGDGVPQNEMGNVAYPPTYPPGAAYPPTQMYPPTQNNQGPSAFNTTPIYANPSHTPLYPPMYSSSNA